jgi:cation:H+ antiporter
MALAELSILVISIVVLSRAASLVADSAVKLARFFNVSTLAIGLLLVSVSTSLPELSVSVMSSVAGEGAIAAGNVFGSNIANILLILGLAAVLYGFKVRKDILPDIAIVLLATTVISVYIMYKSSVEGSALSFYEGVLLLLVFVWYANRILSKKRIEIAPAASKMSLHEGLYAFLFFGAGVVVVIISSSFVVDSAVSLAKIAGLAESFIGATIIAIGTSLPELSVDLAAIRKKQYGLALGDAIGSNMANLTLVLGTAAAISPIVVQLKIFSVALLFAIIANMVFFYVAVVKKDFGMKEGIAMLALYAIYIIAIFYLQFS